MADIKTKVNDASVDSFIDSIADEIRKRDSRILLELMKQVTNDIPKMWGTNIVGFGTYHYKYASGREGDFMRVGFSPRKQSLTLYIMPGFEEYQDLLSQLGRHSTGKSCLYIKNLEDVDLEIVRKLVKISYEAQLGIEAS